jgi:hypothetical protein
MSVGWDIVRTVRARGATYTGPGDVVTGPLAGYSTVAWNSASRGNKLYNICNSTGGTDVGCADIFSSATTGLTVPATVGGITCPAASVTVCTVKTWYDGTGNGFDCAEATIADRPLLLASGGIGSNVTVQFTTTTSNGCASSTGPTYGTTPTFAGVSERYNNTDFFIDILGTASNFGGAWFGTSANEMGMYANGTLVTVTAADAVPHTFQMIFNNASSIAVVDGTATTGLNTGGTFNGSGALGMGGGFQGAMNTLWTGVWSSNFNSTQYGAMCHNDNVLFSLSLSC